MTSIKHTIRVKRYYASPIKSMKILHTTEQTGIEDFE